MMQFTIPSSKVLRTCLAILMMLSLAKTSTASNCTPGDPVCCQDPDELDFDACNKAMTSFPTSGEHAMIDSPERHIEAYSGNCQVSIQCRDKIHITAGRVLNGHYTNGGFKQLAQRCGVEKRPGWAKIDEYCSVTTSRVVA